MTRRQTLPLPFAGTMPLVLWLVATLALAGCTGGPTRDLLLPETDAPDEITAGCCQTVGTYPTWVLELADRNVDVIRAVGQIELRRGRLERQPEARALLQGALAPMDVVFVHNRNRVSGQLIPGQFTHGAVYLGTEAQLRAAGLWYQSALAPWRSAIADGAVYLEAVEGGVRLATGDVVLNTDAAVALRPTGMDRAAVLARGLERMGTPFDMHFDATDASALFCAELIGEMYEGPPLPRMPVALPGRETILIDAIVADALAGELPFSLVGYVKAHPTGGASALSATDLARDIRTAWP